MKKLITKDALPSAQSELPEPYKRSDLIERLSEIRSQYNCFDESEEPYYRTLSEAIELIREQPTIEPKRKKGKWVKTYRNGFGSLIGYCDQCGRSASVDNFCPNCGVKME